MEQFKENNTESKIIFFETQNEDFNRPPHDPTHTACSTPNPPWWCNQDDSNAVSIDMYLFVLVLVAILIRLNFKK